MRKKLILYFKRRNHARKQWVSDSLRPYFVCIKRHNLLCEKEKDDFQQRGAGTLYFTCCITVESLLFKITCEGEVPEPAAGSISHRANTGAALITAEPVIDLRKPVHSINVYFVSN